MSKLVKTAEKQLACAITAAIKKAIEKTVLNSTEEHFIDLVNNELINEFVRSMVEKYTDDSFAFEKLSLKHEENSLMLTIAVSGCKYEEICQLVSRKLERMKNKNISWFVIPMLNVLKQVMSDEQKECLIVDSINGCQEGLARMIGEFSKKKGMRLTVKNIRCEKHERYIKNKDVH